MTKYILASEKIKPIFNKTNKVSHELINKYSPQFRKGSQTKYSISYVHLEKSSLNTEKKYNC